MKKISPLQSFLLPLLFLLIIPATLCAQESGFNSDGSEKWEVVYYPKLPANNKIENFDTNLINLIKQCYQVYDLKNKVYQSANEVQIFPDRMEIRFSRKSFAIFNYKEIIDQRICVIKTEFTKPMTMYNPYFIKFKDIISFTYDQNGLDEAKKLADHLFFIQHQLNEARFGQELSLFEPLATQYRELKVKPPVSEEQRKFIVQANAMNQQKDFEKAIGLYQKAIELDPTAYPSAYSNLALLYAQLHMFDASIFRMKQYLMLVPEAQDARGAQDKIYEWEIMLTN